VEALLKRWELSEPPVTEVHIELQSPRFAIACHGQMVAVADGLQRRIHLVDRMTGRTDRELPGCASPTESQLLFSPQGHLLAEVDGSLAVVWDTEKGEALARLDEAHGLTGLIVSVAFTADGKLLAVAERAEAPRVVVWDVLDQERVWQSSDECGIATALVCPDGHRLAGISGMAPLAASGLTVLELPTGRELARSPLTGLPLGKQPISPDGRWLATVSRPEGDSIYQLLVPRGRPARTPEVIVERFPVTDEHWTIAGPSAPSASVFSRDSRWLAIGYRDGLVKLWDTSATAVVFQATLRHRPIRQLAFTEDNRWLGVADGGSTIPFVDLAALHEELATVGLEW
jgi:WD40 repeat protein